jgi:hypothetical protein
VRRGLLQDLANTPTQIACGWRLHGDLPRLRELSGSVVSVDLLTGIATVEGRQLSPGLGIAGEASSWLRERVERDGVPAGTVEVARLVLRPHDDDRGALVMQCATVLRTAAALPTRAATRPAGILTTSPTHSDLVRTQSPTRTAASADLLSEDEAHVQVVPGLPGAGRDR